MAARLRHGSAWRPRGEPGKIVQAEPGLLALAPTSATSGETVRLNVVAGAATAPLSLTWKV